ncbi:MAG: sigma-70 family RNA polymerase sigma factor, partial [Verrucomicrobiaceae bacterium]
TPTRWSLVRRAARQGDDTGMDREEFCRIYWYPLYAAARREGLPPEDACDAVQILFAEVVRKNLLGSAAPEKGRLRSWLLTVLRNQICDRRRAAGAAKRGGGIPLITLDAESAEAVWRHDPALQDDPATAWRRNLATAILDSAVEKLVDLYTSIGKTALVEALLPALEGPLPDQTYDQTAQRLRTTGGNLRMAVLRLRRRYQKMLRLTAAQALGVREGPELNAELRSLFSGRL